MIRIALIHALAHSVAPVNAEFARQWPEATCMNLLDDSLAIDLDAAPNGLDDAMTARFHALADYAVATGADAILFTCSAFGPCIESVARRLAPLPVLKPNEAMIEAALAHGGRIGLIASYAPTLSSMPDEFPPGAAVVSSLAPGALDALDDGDLQTHDERAADAAMALVERGCEVIALAQFSLARAKDLIVERTGRPVFTTVESAVRALRRRLEQPAA